MGKGKVHYIEVLSDEEDESEEEYLHRSDDEQNNREAPHLEISEQVMLQEGTKKMTIATLSGFPKYYTFMIRGIMQGQRVTTLIDGGDTHNIIDVALVTRRQIPVEEFDGYEVVVADGYNVTCTRRTRGLDVTLRNYTLTDDFYVVGLADTNMVLGV
jgi:hypothetical protein